MSLPETCKALIAYGKGTEPKIEEVPLPKPGKNQVLVKVAFAPINPSDVGTILGLYSLPVKPPHPVGMEGAGTVVALGEDLKVPHQVGDRVHVTGLGTFAQYMLADSERCRKVQGDLPFEDAACHFVNPATVVCMGDYVKKNGHKAVIHTVGASALGRMLIRYFKLKGIKTINVVRKDDYIEELKKDGADYVLNSQAPDFEEQLKEIAHKEEATVAFEAVGGELIGKVMKNQPANSTCVLYGALSSGNVQGLNVQQFIFEGKTLTGFWLQPYLTNAIKTGTYKQLADEVYELLPTVLKSNIHKIFKLEEIKDALTLCHQEGSKGKILIQPN